jgi:hypothetical protein
MERTPPAISERLKVNNDTTYLSRNLNGTII